MSLDTSLESQDPHSKNLEDLPSPDLKNHTHSFRHALSTLSSDKIRQYHCSTCQKYAFYCPRCQNYILGFPEQRPESLEDPQSQDVYVCTICRSILDQANS